MALAGNLEADVEISSPAEKFFKLLGNQPHQIPNASTDNVHGVELHEGDWEAAGSVKIWTIVVDGKEQTFKEKVHVDEANKSVTMTCVGGHVLEQYKSYKITLKVIPKDEGSLVAVNLEYEKLKAEDAPPHKFLELAVNILKDMDAHLQKA